MQHWTWHPPRHPDWDCEDSPADIRGAGVAPDQLCGAIPRRLLASLYPPVAEVAVGCALHDGLRAREPDVGAEPLGDREVGGADQQEAEFGRAEFLVKLGVAASRDIEREGILRLLADAIALAKPIAAMSGMMGFALLYRSYEPLPALSPTRSRRGGY